MESISVRDILLGLKWVSPLLLQTFKVGRHRPLILFLLLLLLFLLLLLLHLHLLLLLILTCGLLATYAYIPIVNFFCHPKISEKTLSLE